MKTEVLYGWHSVHEAVRAGRRTVFELCLLRGGASARAGALLAEARTRGVAVKELPAGALDAMAGTDAHQGVAARVSPFACHPVPPVLDTAAGLRPALLMALDCIQDPHNMGALLRTALCAGVEAVVVPKDRSAPPSPAVSKVSAGALEHTRLIQATNLVRCLESIKEQGPWVVGLERDARQSVFTADLTVPLVLVVGGEGRGMRPLVRRTCDMLVSIPQTGPLDSLNASVAAAVALFEILRQRGLTPARGGAGGPHVR
jgi:23S rRNA (guanosine2251-2'-O)-methyltransferase